MQTIGKTEKRCLVEGSRVYTLAPQILFASFGRGGVIFNLDTRESHCLNPTGASVIGLFDGRRNVSAIIDILAQESGVQPDAINIDVARFLVDIMNRGWIDDR
jgi:hypothetical protein